jgi:sulfonate transport system permease protein
MSFRIIPNAGRLAAAPLLPASLVGVWSVASAQGWLPDQILPPPHVVWQTLLETAASGDLWTNTVISLQRVLEGFALGALAGLGFGLILGLSRTVRQLFHLSVRLPSARHRLDPAADPGHGHR